MDPKVYSVLHVASGFLLLALTFHAFAAPKPETRKKILASTGVLSLLMLVGGFGLMARKGYDWEAWLIVKIVCWLGLSALAGFAYRMPGKSSLLGWVASTLVVVALVMVYIVNPGVIG
ncbi:MAG: hypothetical protein AAF726_22800 [Planctomycetota bacterium]